MHSTMSLNKDGCVRRRVYSLPTLEPFEQAYYWGTSEWTAREIEEAHRQYFSLRIAFQIENRFKFLDPSRRRQQVWLDWTYSGAVRTQVSLHAPL